MKIVILDSYTLNPGDLDWTSLKKLGECRFYDRTPNNNREIIKRIKGADIVLTNKTPLNKEVLNSTDTLKYIGEMATGYDNIDMDVAALKNITVTNAPDYSTDAVAQFTFSLLLEITSNVGLHNELVHLGNWQRSKDFTFWEKPLIELRGKTIGIIGFGKIARKVSEIAHAFSMNVIFYNHHLKKDVNFWEKQVVLDTLLKKSDIISLHVPETSSTRNIICKKTIDRMKDGTILINTARGKLLNEKDVSDALNSNKIRAVAVDVVSKEPISEYNPLLTAKNCFITPHIAWAALDTRERLLKIIINNLESFLNNKPINKISL